MSTTTLAPSSTAVGMDAAYAYTTLPVSLMAVPSAHPTCNAVGDQGLMDGKPMCQISGQDIGAYQAMQYCCNRNNQANDIQIIAYAGKNSNQTSRDCGLLCILNTNVLGSTEWNDCMSGSIAGKHRNVSVTMTGCNGFTPAKPGEKPKLGSGSKMTEPSLQKVWVMMTALVGVGLVLGAM